MAMDEVFELPPDEVSGYGGQRMVDLLHDWLRGIREGDNCRNTPESTIATLEVIDTIYEASEKAKRIECNIEAK
jgi:predicted dehydrogenase